MLDFHFRIQPNFNRILRWKPFTQLFFFQCASTKILFESCGLHLYKRMKGFIVSIKKLQFSVN